MKYKNIIEAKFISRPNRFIAICEYENIVLKAHVKNTGRLKELLIPGNSVYLEHIISENRKTQYDLISAQKGKYIVNIDSQAPNKIFQEGLKTNPSMIKIFNPKEIKREKAFFESRFDFFINENHYIEVKGVSLEENKVCLFPDAPTERGIKHLNSLIKAKEQGFNASVVFIIQLENAAVFSPNYKAHPAFALALKKAHDEGVNIYAFSCKVDKNSISADRDIEVKL